MNVAGRQVVVTGGSSGIGKAIARELLRRGAHVHLLARRKAQLDAALGELEAARRDDGQRCTARPCDVADREEVEAAFAALRAEGCRVWGVVNSAGISGPARFQDLSADDFERTMRVNYHGSVDTIRAALPDLEAQGSGWIVNVGSVAGLMGVFGFSAYSGSKFAVTGFSQALRSELAPKGIQVTLLCPPDTDTPMLEAENLQKPPETRALSEGADLLSAEQVAAALFRGAERGHFLVVPGWKSRAILRIQRLLPGLVDRIVDGTVRRVGRQA